MSALQHCDSLQGVEADVLLHGVQQSAPDDDVSQIQTDGGGGLLHLHRVQVVTMGGLCDAI